MTLLSEIKGPPKILRVPPPQKGGLTKNKGYPHPNTQKLRRSPKEKLRELPIIKLPLKIIKGIPLNKIRVPCKKIRDLYKKIWLPPKKKKSAGDKTFP